jgi:hypothetical protein
LAAREDVQPRTELSPQEIILELVSPEAREKYDRFAARRENPDLRQVRKTPGWPRSWANFSPLSL